MEPIRICIYTVHGCEVADDVERLVRSVVSDMTIQDVEIRRELILDQEDAERKRFLGSPTVKVDGVDVEWTPFDYEFAYGSRLYMMCGRFVRKPSSGDIRTALIAAGANRMRKEWERRNQAR